MKEAASGSRNALKVCEEGRNCWDPIPFVQPG